MVWIQMDQLMFKNYQSLVKQLDMKILISSHKLEDIELICDRAVFLRDGNFVQDVNMKDGDQKIVQSLLLNMMILIKL